MPDWIPWLIAGIYIAGLVIVWFAIARRELTQAMRNMENALRQVQLHIDGRAQVCGGPYEAAAIHSLNVSRLIYRETVKNYETVRNKLVNRLPALLFGYRTISKGDRL